MSHTPGPWDVDRTESCDGHSTLWVIESDTRRNMAILELPKMSQWHKDRHPEWRKEYGADWKEVAANAALIASAPELLTMLKDLLECTKEQLETIHDYRCELDTFALRRPDPPLLALAQQVINKAEGIT